MYPIDFHMFSTGCGPHGDQGREPSRRAGEGKTGAGGRRCGDPPRPPSIARPGPSARCRRNRLRSPVSDGRGDQETGIPGGPSEAHVSAQRTPPGQEARVSGPDEHPWRPRRPAGAPRQRAPSSLGVIASIRQRREFDHLRRSGTRIRPDLPSSAVNRSAVNRALWCSYAPAPPDAPGHRIAFAIGRSVGGAVVRNRLRRRLRACVAETAAAGSLPTGLFLFGAAPSATSLDTALLRAGVASIAAQAARMNRPGGRS